MRNDIVRRTQQVLVADKVGPHDLSNPHEPAPLQRLGGNAVPFEGPSGQDTAATPGRRCLVG